MIISEWDQNIIVQDSVRQLPDTSLQELTIPSDSTTAVDSIHLLQEQSDFPLQKKIYEAVDTTAVCHRNPIYDLIFYDPEDGTDRLDQNSSNSFPFLFLEIT